VCNCRDGAEHSRSLHSYAVGDAHSRFWAIVKVKYDVRSDAKLVDQVCAQIMKRIYRVGDERLNDDLRSKIRAAAEVILAKVGKRIDKVGYVFDADEMLTALDAIQADIDEAYDAGVDHAANQLNARLEQDRIRSDAKDLELHQLQVALAGLPDLQARVDLQRKTIQEQGRRIADNSVYTARLVKENAELRTRLSATTGHTGV
jgi:hypothetical protein